MLEWRISTVARFTVESVARSDTGFDTDHDWYRVTVQTEASFSVLCPTIARATQAVLIFDRLQRDLFHVLGWFSWPGLDATEDGPKPPDLG